MYTVLRISGSERQLNKLLSVLIEMHSDLSPKINKRKELGCILSQNQSVEHWAEVADALGRVSDAISESEVGDITLIVETRFELKKLPDGSVAADTLSVSQIALAAMTNIGADFEASLNRPAGEDEA
jgi:hypothetical protein